MTHDYNGTMAQHERELLVGATLDLTLDTLETILADEGLIEAATHLGLDGVIGTMIVTLRAAPDPEAGHVYLQQIGLMSDQSMHWIVSTFGECPLHG